MSHVNSDTIQHDTVMVDTSPYTCLQTHTTGSTKSEH